MRIVWIALAERETEKRLQLVLICMFYFGEKPSMSTNGHLQLNGTISPVITIICTCLTDLFLSLDNDTLGNFLGSSGVWYARDVQNLVSHPFGCK